MTTKIRIEQVSGLVSWMKRIEATLKKLEGKYISNTASPKITPKLMKSIKEAMRIKHKR